MNRALFLDRDGVINIDYGHVHKPKDFCFREGIFEVCRAAHDAGLLIVVVTNQGGIGRGLYSFDDFKVITDYMLQGFRENAIQNMYVYFCPFHPLHGIGHFCNQSYFRKPHPGMLLAAIRDHNINPFHSMMIGDNATDKMASCSVGIRHYVDACSPLWRESALITLYKYLT